MIRSCVTSRNCAKLTKSGVSHRGGKTYQRRFTMDEYPVYVKAGSIIPYFGYETGYTTMGGKKVPRFYLHNLPNMNVTWETTKTFNIGLDFTTLNGRLSGVIDFYDKQTSGILYRPTIGLTFGDKVAPLQNLAGVNNRGLEATFRWEDKIGDVTYGVAVNGSFNKNRVTDYKGAYIEGWGADPNNPDPNVYYSNLGEVSSGGTQRLVEGHMMNEFYVYPIYSGSGQYYDANGAVNPNGGPVRYAYLSIYIPPDPVPDSPPAD